MTAQRFLALLELYKEDRLSASEYLEWLNILSTGEYRELLEQEMGKTFDHFDENSRWSAETEAGLLEKIRGQAGIENGPQGVLPVRAKGGKLIPIRAYRWAAAIAVLLILGGAYFYPVKKTSKQNLIVEKPVSADIKAPSANRASITLAGGKKVFLDSAANGTLFSQGDVQVKKLADGQIAYIGSTGEMALNTLTNPRGSKVISMTLTDGSKIWLNAGSSLIYPVVFSGRERKVEITGEAYFEISHQAGRSFTVTANETQIEVLGTHFNINAYADEPVISATLLEGSIKLSTKNKTQLLSPGQQVQVQPDGQAKLIQEADIEKTMAWKNGVFYFHHTSIYEIMREMSRWYDIDVQFRDRFDDVYLNGSIQRTTNISEVFKMIELTGEARFKIEGKKIEVMK